MGCAGSNPLPGGDTMTAATNGHASPLHMADPTEKPCTMMQKMTGNANIEEMVQKVVSNVSMDDMVKKIKGTDGGSYMHTISYHICISI